jgi:hypothetical protein
MGIVGLILSVNFFLQSLIPITVFPGLITAFVALGLVGVVKSMQNARRALFEGKHLPEVRAAPLWAWVTILGSLLSPIAYNLVSREFGSPWRELTVSLTFSYVLLAAYLWRKRKQISTVSPRRPLSVGLRMIAVFDFFSAILFFLPAIGFTFFSVPGFGLPPVEVLSLVILGLLSIILPLGLLRRAKWAFIARIVAGFLYSIEVILRLEQFRLTRATTYPAHVVFTVPANVVIVLYLFYVVRTRLQRRT